ncbi:MAG TPA: YceI family protein [Candidatus Sulfotelmatobacter sp.]|nr:YceI family protein [Candidatus Sulfotelmatobacter sp.]
MHYAIDPKGTPEDATVRYDVDSKGSTFIVRAFTTGLLAAFGHNPTIAIPGIEGEIVLNPDAIDGSSLRMVVDASSLAATDDISAKDRDEINRRMHAEVLESDSFPQIVYETSRVSASKTAEGQYWAAITGELAMHGVTKTQPISARLSVNGTALRATGEFSVRQSDYEIRPVSAVGGTVRLKDELKLSFDITARKQA